MATNENLDKILAELRRGPRTARALAKAVKCSKPTAYARLAALEARGQKLERTDVRESTTGPASVAYSLAQ